MNNIIIMITTTAVIFLSVMYLNLNRYNFSYFVYFLSCNGSCNDFRCNFVERSRTVNMIFTGYCVSNDYSIFSLSTYVCLQEIKYFYFWISIIFPYFSKFFNINNFNYLILYKIDV